MSKLLGTENVLDSFDTVLIDFDELENLRAMRHEIATNPEAVLSFMDNLIYKSEERLVKQRICPICGNTLEYERTTEKDTSVPYGSTYVVYDEAYDVACPACSYRREE